MRPRRILRSFLGQYSRFTPSTARSVCNLLAAVSLGLSSSLLAEDRYWDTNSTTAGAGSAASGTWDGSTLFWNTDPTGGSSGTLSAVTGLGDALFFVAGPSNSSGNSTSTISLVGTRSAYSLNFNHSGALSLENGTIDLQNGIFAAQYAYGTTARGAVTIASNINLQASQSFTNNGTASLTINGIIDDGVGNYTITKAGTGNLTLGGGNTHSGGVTLNAGRLTFTHAQALGTGTLTINGGTLSNSAALTLTTNNAQIWNGDFSTGMAINNNLNLGTGAVTLGNNVKITTAVNGYASQLIVGGVIDDGAQTYGLTIQGGGANPGSVTLNGSNTFGGGASVLSGGTLRIGNAGALGTGTLTLNGGTIGKSTADTELILSTNNAQIWSGNWGLINGTGNLNLGNGNVQLTGTRTISISNSGLTVEGVIANSGGSNFGLIFNFGQFSGSATLKGANTFDGGVTLLTASNSSVETFNIGNLGVDLTASAIGTGTLTFSPTAGTLRFNNSSGAAGTLATNNAQVWNGSFTFVGSNSLHMGTNTVTMGASVTVTVDRNELTIGGVIDDGAESYDLSVGAAVGTSAPYPPGGTLILSGANTYSGNTIIHGTTTSSRAAGGKLKIDGGNNRLPTGTHLTVNGTNITGGSSGSFDLNGYDQTISGLSGGEGTVARGIVTNNTSTTNTSTLTITGSGSFNGIIRDGTTGKMAVTKTGAGKQVLSGVNTYSGATTVEGGELEVNGSINNSAVTVMGDGILSGSGSTGAVILAEGGTLSPGNSPGSQTMASLTLHDGGNYNWQILDATGSAGTGYDVINVTGSLDLSNLTGATDFNINLWSLSSTGPDVNGVPLNLGAAHTWTLIATNSAITGFDASEFTINSGAFNGTGGFAGGGNFTLGLGDGGTDLVLNYTPVPEPGAIGFLALGLAFLAHRRRRA